MKPNGLLLKKLEKQTNRLYKLKYGYYKWYWDNRFKLKSSWFKGGIKDAR